MELFLNAAWFVIVVAAVVSLLRSQRFSDRRQLLSSLGALLCALVLIFPSISLTDDLHYEDFVFQDSSSTKRLISAVHNFGLLGQVFWSGAAILAGQISAPRITAWRLTQAFTSYCTPLLIAPLPARAPPSLLPR